MAKHVDTERPVDGRDTNSTRPIVVPKSTDRPAQHRTDTPITIDMSRGRS